jgi:hypothetical protein
MGRRGAVGTLPAVRTTSEEDAMLLAASNYPLLNLFWTTFIIFGWILWFWLLIRVYTDVFRRQDIGGWAKTGWVVFTLVLPFIGVLIYLIGQGRGMQARAEHDVREQRAATDAYIRSVAADAGSTQMTKARDLLASGAITSDEFDRMVGNSPTSSSAPRTARAADAVTAEPRPPIADERLDDRVAPQ